MNLPKCLIPGRATLPNDRLRVALVTSGLRATGGAEKQSYYIARALAEAAVDVRVYTTLKGGEYGESLRDIGVQSEHFGGLPGLPFRLVLLIRALRSFRPQIIQSIHAWTNVYSAIAGRVLGAISIGGLRGDLNACFADYGRLTRCLLTWPDALAPNSRTAVEEIKNSKLLHASRIHLLPNAIDPEDFPEHDILSGQLDNAECTCITVGRLRPFKRVDVFLRALAAARSAEPALKGIVVGWGDETAARLEQLATELGLFPHAVKFLGYRSDIAALLQQASVFVFCSESEGTPNVILEAMAANLPIITTPAGDAAELVDSAGAGYVIPFGDVEATADAMIRLARTSALRRKLGAAGREYVTHYRAISQLGRHLLKIYGDVTQVCARSCRHTVLNHIRSYQNSWNQSIGVG